MSDKMRAIPFGDLIKWIMTEYEEEGTIFGVSKFFYKEDCQNISLFGETMETPFGPAAGPHNQLAQNISAGYVSGARFFELKTVQTLDGDDLPVAKPCIAAPDECYNCDLHGCPPAEIERIASYLIKEKGLNTFVKCNPTMLGYEDARGILDSMGYDYMDFDDYHFLHDLQFMDAVPMITRLKADAAAKGVAFGVKITNTFPQKVTDGILPSEDMYMSGRSLFPCSIELANRLANAFDGDLHISFSGGADAFNIVDIFAVGIWPITLATTLLKPGGYNRLAQMAEDLVDYNFKEALPLKPAALAALSKRTLTNPQNLKGAIKPLPSRKIDKKVPLVDCFIAPCKAACPISQDIPEYLQLLGEDRPTEALKAITRKNPLPFITGTICSHFCMDKCTRNFYDEPICIRDVKLDAAELGFDNLLKTLAPVEKRSDAKVAIIGGGPAGIAAAYFLARSGMRPTIFEAKDTLGGIVRHVIPSFRIDDDAIENDVALMKAYGVYPEPGPARGGHRRRQHRHGCRPCRQTGTGC